MSDSWNDRMRDVTKLCTKQIPYVGFLVSSLVILFWPADEEDIWSLVKKNAEALVDQKILEKEIEQSTADLNTISELLHNYSIYSADGEQYTKTAKVSYLSDAIQLELQCFNRFISSSNAHLIIPLTVTLAHLHLSCLQELYIYGAELYCEKGDQAKINTQNRLNDLCDKYLEYKEYFDTNFKKWLTYRESKLSIKQSYHPGIICSCDCEVKDDFTGEHFKYSEDTCDSHHFEPLADSIRRRLINQTTTDFISQYLCYTFNLSKYLPQGLDINSPETFCGDPTLNQTESDYMGYETLKFGPYSPATLGISQKACWKTAYSDVPGTIKKILIREYNSIDGIQFFYADHDGCFIGNAKGGTPHNIEAGSDKHFTGMNLRFANGLACSAELTLYNNILEEPTSSSGTLGNRSNWKGTDVKAEVNGGWYRLCGGSFAEGVGPSSTRGLGLIELEFTAVKK